MPPKLLVNARITLTVEEPDGRVTSHLFEVDSFIWRSMQERQLLLPHALDQLKHRILQDLTPVSMAAHYPARASGLVAPPQPDPPLTRLTDPGPFHKLYLGQFAPDPDPIPAKAMRPPPPSSGRLILPWEPPSADPVAPPRKPAMPDGPPVTKMEATSAPDDFTGTLIPRITAGPVRQKHIAGASLHGQRLPPPGQRDPRGKVDPAALTFLERRHLINTLGYDPATGEEPDEEPPVQREDPMIARWVRRSDLQRGIDDIFGKGWKP